jgi:hypothetical protein
MDEKIPREELYDRVVLAVTPDVVARVFAPLAAAMSNIPTIVVQSNVLEHAGQQSRFSVVEHGAKSKVSKDELPQRRRRQNAELISLRTRFTKSPNTEALHEVKCGAIVATCAIGDVEGMRILHASKFPRVLRTPQSRVVVNSLFRDQGRYGQSSASKTMDHGWKNGDSGVWLAGGWCWDGMVLLEGCVVSAMRVANAFDVDVPWSS